MPRSNDTIQKDLDTTEKDIKAVEKKLRPLKKRQKELWDTKDLLEKEKASLLKGDFPSMLKEKAADSFIDEFLLEFQETPNRWHGLRRDGYRHHGYKFFQHAFSLTLQNRNEINKVEQFFSKYIKYFELSDDGWDRPYVHFSFATDEGGLDWLAWDGEDWYILRFVYGRVRRTTKCETLKAGLEYIYETYFKEDSDV